MLSINERTGTYMYMRPEPGVTDRVSVFHIISMEELLLGCSLKDDNDVSHFPSLLWKCILETIKETIKIQRVILKKKNPCMPIV